jgi:hypothetical protein
VVTREQVNETERPEDTLRRYARKLVKLGELHSEYRIYEECDHAHAYEEDRGGVIDCGDFVTCEDGYLYAACRECCTDEGGQTEACGDGHHHGTGKPICPTAAILGGTP